MLLSILCLTIPSRITPPAEHSVFLPPRLIRAARTNIAREPWARQAADGIVAAAKPWSAMTDAQLWNLMFGATIKRSWMVWSNGHCPSCRQSVPMYTWQMNAINEPWKVRCPHCHEAFPKNDFGRYYRSGLDPSGVFDPKLADRSLLYNTEHPNPDDPLHGFGVDDGDGYVDGDERWRFIGAYLIYGQWKQAVYGGVVLLANAYTVTGDTAYAHKAAVLLDRIADLYPSFDFGKQGVMYEGPPRAGYVSTWHDACEETRQLAEAYDQIRDALPGDTALTEFLSAQARNHGLANPKATWADVRTNIEDGILRHALAHRERIYSNYPRTEIALATIMMVLGWPENRTDVMTIVDPMIDKATAVDGVTGEKGLSGYTAYTIQGVAEFLASLARIDRSLLKDLLQRHPRIKDMFRFHIDTWCFGRYYPQSGDTGGYAAPVTQYVGASFSRVPGLQPSSFTLMGALADATGDPAFLQVAYLANGRTVDGLPHDLFSSDAAPFRRKVAAAVRRFGPEPVVGSVNKEQWRLAILRSGVGDHARALWLDYDAGGAHGHFDALNLGLFACGLDLLPELGYPPVQFGGWEAPRAVWYTRTAAHNTVVIDGANQKTASGACTLWADGESTHAVAAACPEAASARRFERTAVLCDVADNGFYVVDLLRVEGGSEHVRFQHSHFGTLTLDGLSLAPESDYGHATQMRAFRMGSAPEEGFRARWEIQDRYKLIPPERKVVLDHYDFTRGAEAGACEGWIAIGGYNATEELWVPRLVVRRRGVDLSSAFLSILAPHDGAPALSGARRLSTERRTSSGSQAAPYGDAALEVRRSDGQTDIVIIGDAAAGPARIWIPERQVEVDPGLCRITLDRDGAPRYISLSGGAGITCGEVQLRLKGADTRSIVEIRLDRGRARAVRGKDRIEALTIKGRAVPIR